MSLANRLHVVGNGSWKKQKLGKLSVEMKLKKWSWKILAEMKKHNWTWEWLLWSFAFQLRSVFYNLNKNFPISDFSTFNFPTLLFNRPLRTHVSHDYACWWRRLCGHNLQSDDFCPQRNLRRTSLEIEIGEGARVR